MRELFIKEGKTVNSDGLEIKTVPVEEPKLIRIILDSRFSLFAAISRNQPLNSDAYVQSFDTVEESDEKKYYFSNHPIFDGVIAVQFYKILK